MAVGGVQTTKDIFKLVDADLVRVESELRRYSGSDVLLVEEISRYVHSSGGKRVRPALLLLAAGMCGHKGDQGIRLGAVVEFIHVATLVHDDIIDNASLRRGRPSVNHVWGNSITVLMGDWLYMTSFKLALELHDFRILGLLIDITRKMVEGELLQMHRNGSTDISVDEQLDICLRKTAFLFSGCARLGAMLGKVGEAREDKLGEYGRSLGMAFQLIDDLLDYTASERILGKPVLKDLEEGRVTLPITYLLERATNREQDFVRRVIKERDLTAENRRRIIELVSRYETGFDVRRLAERFADAAKASLADFPDSVYKDALLRIPDFVMTREA
jgi:octaprenyl-diphosphate synthase